MIACFARYAFSNQDKCIAEVRHEAQFFKESKCIETLDGVYESDTIVLRNIRQALQKAVNPLEDLPGNGKDWDPEADQQVLDLVHPSIYPLAYGQFRILPTDTVGLNNCVQRCGEGQIVVLPEQDPVEELGPLHGGHHLGDPPDNRWSHK